MTATPLASTCGDVRHVARWRRVRAASMCRRGSTACAARRSTELTSSSNPSMSRGDAPRMGVEVSYTPGPVGLAARMDAGARSSARTRASATSTSPTSSRTGWYAAATWLVTGEDKEDFNNPRQFALHRRHRRRRSWRALRRARVRERREDRPGVPNPRAEHILGNSDAVWTFAVNWFPNRWVRVTVNAIHEELEDPARAPIPGRRSYWSALARLQLVF